MNSNYLFVYGTLLENVDNDMSRFLSSNSMVMGNAYFHGRLFKISWFPGAVISDDLSEKVYGTFIKLNNAEETLSALDYYEGYHANNPKSSLFIRQLITIIDEKGATYEAWTYLYNQNVEEETRIHSGDFLKDAES
ncbi:gamma-glutamylcyclotransferase [Seonamhaeicola sp. MEBiC1930]|uniref:gamma-glutamylcyclotransferase family protein n=1 Tax=Seonamhaeicola sp. MEBiC01930 TaxID=2976768 RepID=UPI00324DE94A